MRHAANLLLLGYSFVLSDAVRHETCCASHKSWQLGQGLLGAYSAVFTCPTAASYGLIRTQPKDRNFHVL